jgi:hypothetical protein
MIVQRMTNPIGPERPSADQLFTLSCGYSTFSRKARERIVSEKKKQIAFETESRDTLIQLAARHDTHIEELRQEIDTIERSNQWSAPQ